MRSYTIKGIISLPSPWQSTIGMQTILTTAVILQIDYWCTSEGVNRRLVFGEVIPYFIAESWGQFEEPVYTTLSVGIPADASQLNRN